MLIPILGIGKVAIKQKVNIRLHNYPDKEFGLLLGEVTNISPVANKDKLYMIQVRLTNGLTTTYQKKLDFAQQMNGTGEIITEEKRILERVFENVLDLIKN